MNLKNIEMTLCGRIGNMIYEIFSIFYFCKKYNIPTDIIRLNTNYILYDVIRKQKKLVGNDNYLELNMPFFENICDKFHSEEMIEDFFMDSDTEYTPYNICINLKCVDVEDFIDKNIDYIKNCINIKLIKYYDDKLNPMSSIVSKMYSDLDLYKKLFYNQNLFEKIRNNDPVLKNKQRPLCGLTFRLQEFKHDNIIDTINHINSQINGEYDCYIFSDDIENLKFNIDTKKLNFENIYFHNNNLPYIDLISLSMCDKIIGNQPLSSFIINAKMLSKCIKL